MSGTGIVTSVPSDAPDDYAALRDVKNKAVSVLLLNVHKRLKRLYWKQKTCYTIECVLSILYCFDNRLSTPSNLYKFSILVLVFHSPIIFLSSHCFGS